MALVCIFLAGCAGIDVSGHGVYPFSARFDASVERDGRQTRFSGAVRVLDSDRGMAQVYGPGGLALYTLEMDHRDLLLMDMWGRTVFQESLPVDGVPGLIAGVLPQARPLMRCSQTCYYPWGSLHFDRSMLPRQVHAGLVHGMDAFFISQPGGIRVLVNRGDTSMEICLQEIQGGRWSKYSMDILEGEKR